MITDYSGWANRVWVLESGDASVTYDACAGTPEPAQADMVWDFDGNGNVDALTDGLLLLRYAFELRGDRLVNSDVVATDSPLTAAEIEARIDAAVGTADIDGNGSLDPLSDGLLLLRYLFEVTDDSLVDGVVDLNCGVRTTAADVAQH